MSHNPSGPKDLGKVASEAASQNRASPEAATDEFRSIADTVDRPERDEAIGEQLDRHVDALERGVASPLAPDADPEVKQLRVVVDDLHHVSSFVRASPLDVAGIEDDEVHRLPTVDRSPPAQRATSAVEHSLPPRIGKFEIRRALGVGGQGSAFVAFDPDLKRHVVIKLYHRARDAQAQDQVLNEGRALARVKSPHVAQCFGADRHEGVPYLVVEYIPGRNLDQLHRSKPLDATSALELIGKVADGLAAVHACGLLHRDLKPSNIMVGDDGVPRLVDFGLATHLASDDLGSASGTFAFMAPEQARGEVERIDPRSDIFGLGAVLYALLTGRPPYQAADPVALWSAASAGDIVPPIELKPDLPRAVSDLCMQCLAKDPAQRFASAADLKKRIDRLNPRRWKGLDLVFRLGSRRFRFAIGTAAALLLLAPLAWYSFQGTRQSGIEVASRELIPHPDSAPAASVGPVAAEQPPTKVGEQIDSPAVAAAASASMPAVADLQVRPPASVASAAMASAAPLRTKSPIVAAGRLSRSPVRAAERPRRRDFQLRAELIDSSRGPNPETPRAEGDEISIRVEADRDCYVGVWLVEADRVVQLLPNAAESDHRLSAGQPRVVPGEPDVPTQESKLIRVTRSYLHVVASTQPLTPTDGERLGPYVVITKPADRARWQEWLRGLTLKTEPPPDDKPLAVSEATIRYEIIPSPGPKEEDGTP